MRDSFLSDDAGADGRETQDAVSVCRVTHYTSTDLLSALALYNEMIPAEQRQGPRRRAFDSFKTRLAGGLKECPFEDYHFVAKLDSRVCGYMQLFFYPVEKFALVGFLVVRAGLSLGKQMAWVTSRMCQEITRKLELDDEFRGCDRLFLELDDPGRASDEKKRRRGVRRITRFEAICQQCGTQLRLLEFNYLQGASVCPPIGRGRNGRICWAAFQKGLKRAWTESGCATSCVSSTRG